MEKAFSLGRPRNDNSIENGSFNVTNNQVGIHCHFRTQPGTILACTKGGIKGKGAGFDFSNRQSVIIWAGHLLREASLCIFTFTVNEINCDLATG
jgi:hypothetical protein